jgi:glycosyltransferase involved in cell wall biosynthesis
VGEAAFPIVSVIVPHYNDLDHLHRCVRLLAEQTAAAESYEVIVADNNSRCGFAEVESVCAGFARVVPAPVQGAGEARNAGVRATRAPILAFVDSDCRPAPDWIERGLAAIAGADIVGGRVDVDVVDPAKPTGEEAFEKVFGFNFKHYIEKMGFTGSGNLFVRRSDFDRVGGFRTGVAEDVEWSRRATALGLRLTYAEDVVVSHPARRDWDQLKAKWRRTTSEGYLLMCERPFGRALWFLRSFSILGSPLVHSVTVLRSNKLNGLDQKASAIAVLFKLRGWRFYESHRLLLSKQMLSAKTLNKAA